MSRSTHRAPGMGDTSGELMVQGAPDEDRQFTQNLSVFRRDVAEALRSDGGAEPCGLDMMS